MNEVSLEKCEWCNGSGKEGDNHYPCFDCEGTGYKEGKKAKKYFFYLLDEKEKELEKQGLL